MADLTLKERFGENVVFNPTAKTLTIKLSDLTGITVAGEDVGLDTSNMTAANQDSYSSRILWSLLQLQQQNQPENNNDETVGVYVTNGGKRDQTRNSVRQHGFILNTVGYINDTQGVILDPDSIGG